MFIAGRTLSGISLLLLAGTGVGALSSGHGSTLSTLATRALTGWVPQAFAAGSKNAAESGLLVTALDLQQSVMLRLAAPTGDTAALDAQVADLVIRIETWFSKANANVSDSPTNCRLANAWTDYRASIANALALARAGRVTDLHAAAPAIDTNFRRFVVTLAVDD